MADLFNRGWRPTAVGGSDDNTPYERDDSSLGTPATVVWARELSETAIVEGLKSGRVYVRTRGPHGPTLDFEAVAGGTACQMGGTIAASSGGEVRLRATLAGASGQTLEWVRNGEVFASEPVVPGVHEQSVLAQPNAWFSIVVREKGEPTLLSNAIYMRSSVTPVR